MVYDVVIIGAGPAGSTFARLIAEQGYKILLIDGQGAQNKKPCGGLLAPDAQKALAHFDLTLPKSVLVDPQIFSVKTIDVCRRKIRYYSRHYLNMDRYAFDAWLVSLIPESVEILRGRCVKLAKEETLFDVAIRTAGQERHFKAKTVVGADGANSIVRKSFIGDSVMKYVAIQQWFANNRGGTSFYSCVFDRKTSESCSWSICKDNHFIYGGCFRPEGCRAAFEAQKKRLSEFQGYAFDACLKTEACLALRPRKPRDFQTGKDGVFLIGEAAGFISPSSFEGISYAIVSGRLLAEAFLKKKEISRTEKLYHAKTRGLRRKLLLKMIKRWFMYTPAVRAVILKTGIGSIALWTEDSEQK
ncbi:MAG: FAD-binding protein [Clostridia bacterium]